MLQRLLALLPCFLCAALAYAQPVTPPPIAARAYLLVDALSGKTLAAASEDDRFDPASLTKIMTAYVALAEARDKRFDPAAAVKVPERVARAPGARIFLVAGSTATGHDLMRGMIVTSANDAAMALAEAVAGSEDAFVALMNRHAARLGLTATKYANPTGQPAPGHQTSARDLATLTLALVRDFPDAYPLFSQKTFAHNKIEQSNRNRLLWSDATVDGVKTGFTEAAGYCLVSSARRGERRLVSVVLGTASDTLRIAESQKLLNFGFQVYETRRLYRAGESVASPPVYKGTKSTARLGFDRDIWVTLPRGRFEGMSAVLETRQPFVAPLAVGQKAGIMKLMRDNAPLAEFHVVALEEVPVAGFLSRGWDTLRLMLAPRP